VNTVSLIGNLATDVELREVGADKKVASCLLAVGRGGSVQELVQVLHTEAKVI